LITEDLSEHIVRWLATISPSRMARCLFRQHSTCLRSGSNRRNVFPCTITARFARGRHTARRESDNLRRLLSCVNPMQSRGRATLGDAVVDFDRMEIRNSSQFIPATSLEFTRIQTVKALDTSLPRSPSAVLIRSYCLLSWKPPTVSVSPM
jgi:hypothetical protein